LAHYPIKLKGGADTVYLRPPVNAARAKYAAGLGFTTPGTKRGHNSGYRAAAGRTNKVSFLAAAYTPFREQKVECHPLEFSYLRKHIHHYNLRLQLEPLDISGSGYCGVPHS